MRYVVLLALASCTIDAQQLTGPTIELQLTSNGFDSVQDTEPMPSFSLGTDTQYSIDTEVFTHAGEAMTKTSSKSSQVQSATVTFSLAGAAQPSPALTSDLSLLDPTFKSTSPLVVPGSAKGGMLAVHATATDGNGLASNIVDFSIALQ